MISNLPEYFRQIFKHIDNLNDKIDSETYGKDQYDALPCLLFDLDGVNEISKHDD
jgi:hypothetical protein